MSAEPSSTAPALSASSNSPSNTKDRAPLTDQKLEPITPSVTTSHATSGTPSKVTINVRDPSLANSSVQLPSQNTVMAGEESAEVPVTDDFHMVSEANNASPPTLDPSLPSSMDSPRIEVAEPEYMDENAGPTVWMPAGLNGVSDIDSTLEVLLRDFPYNSIASSPATALTKVIEDFTDSPLDTRVLIQLADWFERYLKETQSLSSQWYDLYTAAREFWDMLPKILGPVMSRRGRAADEVAQLWETEDDHTQNPLLRIASSFTVMVARLLQTDCQTQDETAGEAALTPDLVSTNWIDCFNKALSDKVDGSLTKFLRTVRWETDVFMMSIINTFAQPPAHGLEHLSKLINLTLDRIPLDVDLLVLLFTLATFLTDRWRQIDRDVEGSEGVCYNVPQAVFNMFRATSDKLNYMIGKQASCLNVDTLKTLTGQLSHIAKTALAADGSLAEDLIPESYVLEPSDVESQQTYLNDRATLIDSAWRMEFCKKCIIEGRMDSRIHGVDNMQLHLVEMWRKYIQHKNDSLPHSVVVEYLADFILKSKLVHYLMGVESHPQIIYRSKNIVGFLVVTGKYSNEQTDLIWNSVVSSQDPRTVDAILTMLEGILDLSSIPILTYLCYKLNELPISCFDAKMLSYSANVTEHLAKLWRSHASSAVDLAPYWLIVRLIRQSTAEPGLPIGRRKELWGFAKRHLETLTGWHRIDEQDRLAIFKSSFDDMQAASAAAASSASTLVVLLSSSLEVELQRLNESFGLTSLLVEDFSQLRELEDACAFKFREFPELVTDRIRLIHKLVLCLPDTLTDALVDQLWNSLVGSQALSDIFRDMAWSSLALSAQQAYRRNSFLDLCLRSLLSNLSPNCLTIGVLDFAKSLTEYEARMKNLMYADLEPTSDTMRAEIFRHIALCVPSPEIGAQATSMFVTFNLEDARTRMPLRALDAAQQKNLVDSSVEHLKAAVAKLKRLSDGTLSGEEDSMVIVPSDSDVSAVKRSFARTFTILQEFMRGIRSQYSSSPRVAVQANQGPRPLQDGEIRVQYQPHVGGKPTGMFTMTVPVTLAVNEFLDRLEAEAGFTSALIIAGGIRIEREKYRGEYVRDIKDKLAGLVLVQKAPDSKMTKGSAMSSRLLPLENEVMNHFHQLYDFLSLDEDLGNDVFIFLTAFPAHEDMIETVSSSEKTWSEIFPMESPFKAMYSVVALKGAISQKSEEGADCHQLRQRGVSIVGDALGHMPATEQGFFTGIDARISAILAECLLGLLKDSSIAVEEDYFQDPCNLIERLGLLMTASLAKLEMDFLANLLCNCFHAILEICLRSPSAWRYFKESNWTSAVLERIWLQVQRDDVRAACASALKAILLTLSRFQAYKPVDFAPFFWDRIVMLVPRTTASHNQAAPFFDVAVEVFQALKPDAQRQLPLHEYVQDWTELLLTIPHEDYPCSMSVESMVAGLSHLIKNCITILKTTQKQPLQIAIDSTVRLFRNHLFPPITSREEESLVKVSVPILDSSSRGSLYGLLLAMSTDLAICRELINMNRELLPDQERVCGWSHGIAQIKTDPDYDLSWNFDRWKAVRSQTGYAGIKNLSNTCYMNSLLTQLYMNAKFRDFILAIELTDPENSQRLLSETKTLFAYLQDTWLKAVDPENVTARIITYENTEVDVQIQMDVDEFYNLLFDRWESQILSAQAKKDFRQFYGGQLVQQIKSRDCPHVSERMEPFSAIQCDIQGKSSLVDSLNAYVEGEMMEGDNKYSCSSCGSYVNAVKRACLKDIPDSLIFHLKRFDYDLMTGMRNKINDYFEFPREIDMAIYNFDYLKDPSQKPEPDMFTLVGVLVHSGNAEAGHYYSYIRERPHHGDSWVEFNDAEVSQFDPLTMKETCFGGWAEQHYGVHYPKTWSAYMLFYQRISSMQAEEEHYRLSRQTRPVRVDVPVPLANRLNTENEEWIRRFCMFDQEHARFAKGLLKQFRDFTDDVCSSDHALEGDVISFIVQHLERVFCRQKDLLFLHAVLEHLIRMVERCTECCRMFLSRVISGEKTLYMFLLRCPDENMRRKTATMVGNALKFLRAKEPRLYGLPSDGSEFDTPFDPEVFAEGALNQCVDALKVFILNHTINNTSKAWDDYFGLLVLIASIGRPECETLHDAGYLEYCLQILIVDQNRAMAKHWLNVKQYANTVDKRKYSLRKLVGLVSLLLSGAQSDDEFSSNSSDTQFGSRWGYTLTQAEVQLLKWTTERHIDREDRGLHFLDKIFKVDAIEVAVCQEIVRTLLRLFDDKYYSRKIMTTILQGCTIEPAVFAKPHLSAAVAFCETCPEASFCRQIIERFAREVQSIGASGGEEHFEFFDNVRRVQNQYFSGQKPTFFRMEILKTMHWFAPHLLVYPDASVRTRMFGLIKRLVFDVDTQHMDDEKLADATDGAGKALLKALMDAVDGYIKQNKPIETSRVQELISVIQRCVSLYYESETEEEEEIQDATALRAQRMSSASSPARGLAPQVRLTGVAEGIERLQSLAVSSPDEAIDGEYDSDAALSDDSNSDDYTQMRDSTTPTRVPTQSPG